MNHEYKLKERMVSKLQLFASIHPLLKFELAMSTL